MMRVLNVISYATLILTFTIISAITYMLVYDYTNPPMSTKIVQSDKTVARGGVLTVLNEVERLRDCRVISTREIINLDESKIYELDPTDRDIPKGPDGKTIIREVTIDIPKHMKAGNYSYQSVLNYYCNKSNYLFGPVVIRTPLVFFKVTD